METIQAVNLNDSMIQKDVLKRGDPPWLTELSRAALNAYTNLTWPTTEAEEWRRTDLSSFDFGKYRVRNEVSGIHAPQLSKAQRGNLTFRGPFVTSHAVPDHLKSAGGCIEPISIAGLPTNWGAVADIGPLEALIKKNQILEFDNRVLAWHYSLWTAGAIISVPPGLHLDEPIIIEYLGNGKSGYNAPHTVVVLGKHSRANVIQRFGAGTGADMMWNAGLQIALEPGSKLSLTSMQSTGSTDTFMQHNHLYLGQDARLEYVESLTGGALCKTRTEVHLEGPGSDAQLSGLYIADRGQHIDVRTVQYHKSHHTQSRAFYRGAVKNGGRTIYQGLIDVNQDAVGTDAYLTNDNLILHDDRIDGGIGYGRADSIPSLKIRTNDVKCSHGSTTGKIDDEQLFYLMARGIPRKEARKYLAMGFFEKVIGSVPAEVRDELQSEVDERITESPHGAPRGG